MFAGLSSGVQALGLRFTVSGLLPFVVLGTVGFGLAAMLVAGLSISPEDAVARAATAAGPVGLTALLVGSFVVAVVTQPFQVAIVRLLEGYWGASARAAAARRLGVELQRRRQHRLRVARRQAEDAGDAEEAGHLAARLRRYPSAHELMPTVLGNALRAGERRAGERYGLDTVSAWSRMYYLLPETFRTDVAELHGQVDGSARLAVAFALSGVAAFPLLVRHGWWNLVWIIALALSVLAYRAGVAAASHLSTVLAAAFDLHRFDLIAGLHMPLPGDPATETACNGALSAFLRGDADSALPDGLSYQHHA